MNEVCIFQLKVPLYDSREEEARLVLVCDLLHIESGQAKIVDTFKAKLPSSSFHEYLEIDFYEGAPCQIVGSLHSCLYRFEYLHSGSGVDLKSYCQKYNKHNIHEVIEYLEEESQRNYKTIAENLGDITK